MRITMMTAGLVLATAAVQAGELECNGLVVDGRVSTSVERRKFADGEAVRYRLPDGVSTVACERTEWRIPVDAKVWYQPECPEYEHSFVTTTVGALAVGTKINLPITAKLADGTYRLLTEANVVDYTDSSVEYAGGLLPLKTERPNASSSSSWISSTRPTAGLSGSPMPRIVPTAMLLTDARYRLRMKSCCRCVRAVAMRHGFAENRFPGSVPRL